MEQWKIWKDTRNNTGFGRSAGSLWELSDLGRIRKNGVIQERVLTNEYVYLPGGSLLHREIYKLFVGDIPKNMQIDHIDGCKSNNKLSNLRLVSGVENMANPITRAKMTGKTHDFSKTDTSKMSESHKGKHWILDINSGKRIYY